MKKIMQKKNKGFTLMEVIVVIAILAILAAVAVPTITGYIEESRKTADLQVATNIVRTTQNVVALNSVALPNDGVIEVIWATGYIGGGKYQNMLVVREAGATGRTSVIAGSEYKPSKFSEEALKVVQTSILETIVEGTPYSETGYRYSYLETVKSDAAKKGNFAFHINAGTGEAAIAYNADKDGAVKNLWIDELGVNMTRVE